MPLITPDSFSPVEASPSKSSHPKSLANRVRIHAKAGLDLADHRADGVFRSAKYRQIKRLHRHPQWDSWSDSKKRSMEAAITRRLEERRDRKKRENEMEFSVKWEKGEVAEVAVENLANENDEERVPVTVVPQVDEERTDPLLRRVEPIEGRKKRSQSQSQKRRVAERSVDQSPESDDERSTPTKRAKRQCPRKTLTPKEESGGDDDEDGWVTDDGIVSALWAKKEEGGRAFFMLLDELEQTAKEAYAEFMTKLAPS